MKPYKLVELEQRSDKWFQWRKSKLTASDTPKIMGVSKWSSPYQLWLEKNGLYKQEDNESMRFGRENEEMILGKVNDQLKSDLSPKVVESTLIDFMGASLDGLSSDGKIACEIKCANRDDHSLARESKVPVHYFPQIQKQIFCLGVESILYVSFNNDDLYFFRVDRDDRFIEKMIEKEKEFYKNLINFIPPDLIDKDYERNDSDALYNQMLEMDEIRVIEKNLATRKENLRDNIIKICNNRNTICRGYKISKSIRKGAIDYSKIELLKGIDLEPHRKAPIETWRID